MKIKRSSSPASEGLGNKNRSIVHDHIQESTSDIISKIRRGVHTVWGGIGAKEERKLREVLQKLVDDIDGLEKTLSSTMKRPRENDISAIDNKRHKTDNSSDESSHRNKNSFPPPHIATDALCKSEKIEDDVELLELLSAAASFVPVIDLTADTTSDEESRQACTTHRHDAPLAPEATANEQCGHENDKYAALWRQILEYEDDHSDQESCNGMTNSQGGCQDESLNVIEAWFRDKVHKGHELLGLLALVDFHESDPGNCKAGSEACQNIRSKVEEAEKSMGCDWEKSVGPLARAVSTHLKDAGKDLDDLLERFQDHAKEIEPQPDFEDLLLDNAQWIDRFETWGESVTQTGVERLPASTSKLFLPDRQNTLPRSSCRPPLSPRVVTRTPNKTDQRQDIAPLSNASTVSRGHQAIYTPSSSCQQETMGSSRMFSKSKKVHWPTGKETVVDAGKDLIRDRREERRQRRGF